jgi:hypothetical protein
MAMRIPRRLFNSLVQSTLNGLHVTHETHTGSVHCARHRDGRCSAAH